MITSFETGEDGEDEDEVVMQRVEALLYEGHAAQTQVISLTASLVAQSDELVILRASNRALMAARDENANTILKLRDEIWALRALVSDIPYD